MHRCPYRDEEDVGWVELTFVGPAPELYGLAKELLSYRDRKLTHEEATEELAASTGAEVVTRWTIAGLETEVRA